MANPIANGGAAVFSPHATRKAVAEGKTKVRENMRDDPDKLNGLERRIPRPIKDPPEIDDSHAYKRKPRASMPATGRAVHRAIMAAGGVGAIAEGASSSPAPTAASVYISAGAEPPMGSPPTAAGAGAPVASAASNGTDAKPVPLDGSKASQKPRSPKAAPLCPKRVRKNITLGTIGLIALSSLIKFTGIGSLFGLTSTYKPTGTSSDAASSLLSTSSNPYVVNCTDFFAGRVVQCLDPTYVLTHVEDIAASAAPRNTSVWGVFSREVLKECPEVVEVPDFACAAPETLAKEEKVRKAIDALELRRGELKRAFGSYFSTIVDTRQLAHVSMIPDALKIGSSKVEVAKTLLEGGSFEDKNAVVGYLSKRPFIAIKVDCFDKEGNFIGTTWQVVVKRYAHPKTTLQDARYDSYAAPFVAENKIAGTSTVYSDSLLTDVRVPVAELALINQLLAGKKVALLQDPLLPKPVAFIQMHGGNTTSIAV